MFLADTSSQMATSSNAAVSGHTYTKCSSTFCCIGGSGNNKCSTLLGNSPDNSKALTNSFNGQNYDIKTQRCLLFNKIVELLPDNMVQPKGNLSDFVLI